MPEPGDELFNTPDSPDAPDSEECTAESFEEAIERLEELVREMESGRMGLEESIKSFEEGIRLVRFCSRRLQSAEKTVQRLVAEMGGSFRLEPFEEGEDEGRTG